MLVSHRLPFKELSQENELPIRGGLSLLSEVATSSTAAVYTAKVASLDNLRAIRSTLKVWLQTAKANYQDAQANYKSEKNDENRKLKKINSDSVWVIGQLVAKFKMLIEKAENQEDFLHIQSQLLAFLATNGKKVRSKNTISEKITDLEKRLFKPEGRDKQYSPYVAYTVDGHLQGVAIKSFETDDPDSPAWIDYIATNPDNISKKVRKVKGACTAIIKHIVVDMHKEASATSLALNSLDSSLGFYNKIGLTQRKGGWEDCEFQEQVQEDSDPDEEDIEPTRRMELKEENVESFIERHRHIGDISENEPTLKGPQVSESDLDSDMEETSHQ